MLALALAAGCSGAAVPTLRATAEPVPAVTPRLGPTVHPTSRPTPVPRPTPRPTWEAPRSAVTSARAATKVGKVAIVCGLVAGATYAKTTKGKPTFLNLEHPYPLHRFTIVIWEDKRGRFREPPEKAFLDRPVCIQGLVEDYEGVPQITSVGLDIMSPEEFRPWGKDEIACLRKGRRMDWGCELLLDVQADLRDLEIQEQRDLRDAYEAMLDEQAEADRQLIEDMRWNEEQERLGDLLEGYEDDRYEWIGAP